MMPGEVSAGEEPQKSRLHADQCGAKSRAGCGKIINMINKREEDEVHPQANTERSLQSSPAIRISGFRLCILLCEAV